MGAGSTLACCASSVSALLVAPTCSRQISRPGSPSAVHTSREAGRGMASLRLATFKANGRVSYGAVTGNGIVDLGRKLATYPTLLDIFRGNAISEARAAASGKADYQVKDVEMLP